MKIEFTLVSAGKDEALVTLEGNDWIVAIPATVGDPSAIIDIDELERKELWVAYDHLNENDENETVFCRGEDLDNTLEPYEVAEKLNQLESEVIHGR